jgi:hypothetical protein
MRTGGGDAWSRPASHFAGRSGDGQGRGGQRRPGKGRTAAAGAGEGGGRSRGGRQWLDLFGEEMEKKRKKKKLKMENLQKKPYLKSVTSP